MAFPIPAVPSLVMATAQNNKILERILTPEGARLTMMKLEPPPLATDTSIRQAILALHPIAHHDRMT